MSCQDWIEVQLSFKVSCASLKDKSSFSHLVDFSGSLMKILSCNPKLSYALFWPHCIL